MSKKIDNNELDMILKDIYDTKIPEEKQFSFKGNTQNIKHTVVQKTAESAENTIDTSTVRPVNVFRRITAAAASLVIIGGLGATVFRNAGFEKNKEIYENDSPAMTSFENPEISVTEVSGNEPEQDEPLKLYTYSDYVWDNFNREIIEYPEGYSLDYSVSSGSRIPYLVMKNENSDDETANEIFRVDLDNRTMKSICNADDYAYNVSADGELYAFYYSENETVTAEQLSGDVGITQLPAISEPGRYEVIKGDRKICVQLNAESNPYLIFFDDNGIANKVTECDFVQNTDEIIDVVVKAALSCYGVQGIANKGSLMHPDTSKKGKNEKAIFVKNKLKDFDVDVYLVLSKNVKITEAIAEAQKVIKYRLDKAYPKLCSKVNVYCESIFSK